MTSGMEAKDMSQEERLTRLNLMDVPEHVLEAALLQRKDEIEHDKDIGSVHRILLLADVDVELALLSRRGALNS